MRIIIKEFWQGFIRQLISSNHIKINFKKYGCLEITKTGIEVLKDKLYFNYKNIPIKPPKPYKNKTIVKNIIDSDITLLNALKALRLEISKTLSLPAYIIFSCCL